MTITLKIDKVNNLFLQKAEYSNRKDNMESAYIFAFVCLMWFSKGKLVLFVFLFIVAGNLSYVFYVVVSRGRMIAKVNTKLG